jgi:hypothetical protein
MADVSAFMAAAGQMPKPDFMGNVLSGYYRPLMAQQDYQKAQLANSLAGQDVIAKNYANQGAALATPYAGYKAQGEANEANAKAALTSTQNNQYTQDQIIKTLGALSSNPAAQLNFLKSISSMPNAGANPNSFVPTPNLPPASPTLSGQDMRAVYGLSPTALAGGGMPPQRMAGPVPMPTDFAQYNTGPLAGQPMPQPQAAPPQQGNPSSIAGALASTSTPDLQNLTDAATAKAMGSGEQAGQFDEGKKYLTGLSQAMQVLKNNPDLFSVDKGYGGAEGRVRYEKDKLAALAGGKPSANYQAYTNLENNFGNILPDQQARIFANSATQQNIHNATSLFKGGLSPGSNTPQAMQAMITLHNALLGNLQALAKPGARVPEFEKLSGVPVDTDFSKSPIIPDMSESQLTAFYGSLSPEDRAHYLPAIKAAHAKLKGEGGKQ